MLFLRPPRPGLSLFALAPVTGHFLAEAPILAEPSASLATPTHGFMSKVSAVFAVFVLFWHYDEVVVLRMKKRQREARVLAN